MRFKFLPLALMLAVAAVPSHAEDLLDAFRQAVQSDPTLSTADATRLAVAEGVPQARAALLPQLSAGLSLEQIHSGSSSSTTDGNGNIVSTSAGGHTRDRDLSGSLSQVLVNLSDISALRAAQSTRDAQEQTYEAALQKLYVRVANAYVNVLIAQDNLGVYKSYEDGYKQEYQQASERYKDGLAMAADMTQWQAYYLYIKSERISAQDTLKDNLRALEQITGQPTATLKKLREEIPLQAPTPADPKAWVDQAMQTNPTILAARYTVDADEYTIRKEKAGHLPTLSASVDYDKAGSWSNVTAGSAGYQPGTTTVGLTLTVPLFSGGLTQSQVRQAIHVRDEDAGTAELQRRQAARDVNNYYNLVVDGIEQVTTARESVQAAQKSLTSMQAGYAIGTQGLSTVINAIELLAETQEQYTSVRHNFILNKLLLKQAAGTIDVRDLEDVNRLLQ